MAMDAKMGASERVAADLRRRLAAGEWGPGERIPTISALSPGYASSRMSVARAVRQLVAEGLLLSRGKAGTWVCDRRAPGLVAILANYDFRQPAQASFSGCLMDQVRRRLEADGAQVRVYQEPSAVDWLTDGCPNEALLADAAAGRLAGLVTVSSNYPEWLRRQPLRQLALPTVDLSWHPSRYRVYMDFARAAERAVTLVAAEGLRSMGLIGYPAPVLLTALRREAASRGIALVPAWTETAPAVASEQRGFERIVSQWRRGEGLPQALFVPDDVVAKGVCQGFLSLGLSAREMPLIIVQVSSEQAPFFPCPVLHLVLDLQEMATAAVDLLQRLWTTPDTPATEILVGPRPRAAADLPHLSPMRSRHA